MSVAVREEREGEGCQEMGAACWGRHSGVDRGMRLALVSWGRWWCAHTHRPAGLTRATLSPQRARRINSLEQRYCLRTGSIFITSLLLQICFSCLLHTTLLVFFLVFSVSGLHHNSHTAYFLHTFYTSLPLLSLLRTLRSCFIAYIVFRKMTCGFENIQR